MMNLAHFASASSSASRASDDETPLVQHLAVKTKAKLADKPTESQTKPRKAVKRRIVEDDEEEEASGDEGDEFNPAVSSKSTAPTDPHPFVVASTPSVAASKPIVTGDSSTKAKKRVVPSGTQAAAASSSSSFFSAPPASSTPTASFAALVTPSAPSTPAAAPNPSGPSTLSSSLTHSSASTHPSASTHLSASTPLDALAHLSASHQPVSSSTFTGSIIGDLLIYKIDALVQRLANAEALITDMSAELRRTRGSNGSSSQALASETNDAKRLKVCHEVITQLHDQYKAVTAAYLNSMNPFHQGRP